MSFSDNSIIKVAYISAKQELWIEFENNVRPGYNCAVFVDVPEGVVAEFKASENREEFFAQHIRKNFKRYFSIFAMCEVFLKNNWHKQANDIAKYAEYKEQLDAEMRKKDLDAMNALR